MYACCNTFMAAIDHSNPTAAHPQCMQYMRCDAPSHHVPCSSANWKQSVKDFYNGLEGGVWISFRSMPKVKRRRVATDRDEGSLSETPSARSIGRCPQIDTGPRCSPSACLEMSVKKKTVRTRAGLTMACMCHRRRRCIRTSRLQGRARTDPSQCRLGFTNQDLPGVVRFLDRGMSLRI